MQHNFKLKNILNLPYSQDINQYFDFIGPKVYDIESKMYNPSVLNKVKMMISREMYLLFCELVAGNGQYYNKNISSDFINEFFYIFEKNNIDMTSQLFVNHLCLIIINYFGLDNQDTELINNIEINIIRLFKNILDFYITQYDINLMNIDINNVDLSELNVYSRNDVFKVKDNKNKDISFIKDQYGKFIYPVITPGSLINLYFYKLSKENNPFNGKEVEYYIPVYLSLIGELHLYDFNSSNNSDNYLLLNFNLSNKLKDPIVYNYEYINIDNKLRYQQMYQYVSNIQSSLTTFNICNNKYNNFSIENDIYLCKNNIYYYPLDYRLYSSILTLGETYTNKLINYYNDISYYITSGDIIENIFNPYNEYNILLLYLSGFHESKEFLDMAIDENEFLKPYAKDKFMIKKTYSDIPDFYYNFGRKALFFENIIGTFRNKFTKDNNLYNINNLHENDFDYSNRDNVFKFTDFLNMIPLDDANCYSRRYWGVVRDCLVNQIDTTSTIGQSMDELNKLLSSIYNYPSFSIMQPNMLEKNRYFFNYMDNKLGVIFYNIILHNQYIIKDNIIFKYTDSLSDLFIKNIVVFDRILTSLINLFDTYSNINISYIIFIHYIMANNYVLNNKPTINYNKFETLIIYSNTFILDLNFYARLFVSSKSMHNINPNFLNVNEKNIVYMGNFHTTTIFHLIVNYLSDLYIVKNFIYDKEFYGEYGADISIIHFINPNSIKNLKYKCFYEYYNLFKYNKTNVEMDNLLQSNIINTVKLLKNIPQIENIKPLVNNNYNFTNENVYQSIENQNNNTDEVNKIAFNNYYVYFKTTLFNELYNLISNDVAYSSNIEYTITNFLSYSLNRSVYDDILTKLKIQLKQYFNNYYRSLNVLQTRISYDEINDTVIKTTKGSYQYEFCINKPILNQIVIFYNQLSNIVKEQINIFATKFLRSNIYFDPRYYNVKIIEFIGDRSRILYENDNYLHYINYMMTLNIYYTLSPQNPISKNMYYTDKEIELLTNYISNLELSSQEMIL